MSKINEWGNITWVLFHTMAAQINEHQFMQVKDTLIMIITKTCQYLPCPTCSKHATDILKKAHIKNIQTKEDFIEFLRQFHNIVNIKLKKNTVSKEKLENMYKKNNLVEIVNLFIKIYTTSYGNMKMMMHNFHKELFIKQLIPEFKKVLSLCRG